MTILAGAQKERRKNGREDPNQPGRSFVHIIGAWDQPTNHSTLEMMPGNTRMRRRQWNLYRSYFINALDKFGNTAMHMAVIHDQSPVIDWLMTMEEGKEALEMINFEGFTPLTLAARLGHVQLFRHILNNHLTQTAWTYGRMKLRETDLLQVDTYKTKEKRETSSSPEKNFLLSKLFWGSQHFASSAWQTLRDLTLRDLVQKLPPRAAGPMNTPIDAWPSALEVICQYEVDAFVRDRLFNRLIEEKWFKFARWMYYKRTVLPYLLLLIIFTIMACIRFMEVRRDWSFVEESWGNNTVDKWEAAIANLADADDMAIKSGEPPPLLCCKGLFLPPQQPIVLCD